MTGVTVQIRPFGSPADTVKIDADVPPGEAESSVDWADMTANFYLGFIYSTEAGTDTIAASWAAIQLGDVSLPEDILKNQAIDGLRQNGIDLEAWFTENAID